MLYDVLTNIGHLQVSLILLMRLCASVNKLNFWDMPSSIRPCVLHWRVVILIVSCAVVMNVCIPQKRKNSSFINNFRHT
jgi:hypothetical protein